MTSKAAKKTSIFYVCHITGINFEIEIERVHCISMNKPSVSVIKAGLVSVAFYIVMGKAVNK